jgi:CheY-like chemotaxis protein
VPSPERRADAGARKAKPLKGISVLVVDDSPDELTVLDALLSGAGAEVTAVTKVEDALRALQAARPRILVSDLMIPGHDGFTLIRRIRRMDKEDGGDLPALAISGMDEPRQRQYALDEGFDDFLPKPVHETLVAAVARLVRPRRRTT